MFAKHFVAAHQQVGDFRVVNVNGELVKNGGNVASYVCTPEGRVIHAIVGPVSADTLLTEAQWALDVYTETLSEPAHRQASLMALAHYQELGGAAMHTTGDPWGKLRSFTSQEQRVHELFARRPLPPLSEVYEEVFEKVLGQRVSDGAPMLEAAERGLILAEQTGRPVLFVLHDQRDNAHFQEEWDRRRRYDSNAAALPALLKQYVTIILPLEDLPALSRFLRQPPFESPSSERPLFVVADSQGRQRDAVAGWNARGELTSQLARGLVAELKEDPPTVRELRRWIRFLEKIDRGLAQELINLIPAAQAKAAARLSETKTKGGKPTAS